MRSAKRTRCWTLWCEKRKPFASSSGSAGEVLLEGNPSASIQAAYHQILGRALAREIEKEDGTALSRLAKKEMEDEEDKRLARLDRELWSPDARNGAPSERSGIDPNKFEDGAPNGFVDGWGAACPATDVAIGDGASGSIPICRCFERPFLGTAFDELRDGRPAGRRKLAEWRANIRAGHCL